MNTFLGVMITIVIALAVGDYLDKNFGRESDDDKKSAAQEFDLDQRRAGYRG